MYKKLEIILYISYLHRIYWRKVLPFAWILISLFLALHAKPYAFTVVGNEISQSFNILCCNCIKDGAMSLNPEWNSNSQSRDTWHSTQFVSDRPVFSPEDGRMVEYKIHNTISFIVSISREPFVLKMHNSLAVVF